MRCRARRACSLHFLACMSCPVRAMLPSVAMSAQVRREVLTDGTVVLASERCAFHFSRPRAAIVVVRIIGNRLDTGELGSAPMDELAGDLARAAPIELFIDASQAAGAIVAVQEDWAGWFARHRASLR